MVGWVLFIASRSAFGISGNGGARSAWQFMHSVRSLGTATMPLRWLPAFSSTTRRRGVDSPTRCSPLLVMFKPLVRSASSR
jgi:hypothetical protein